MKMPETLKPCPFCGHKAELRNTCFEICRNRENGDVMTYWFVRCLYCGTERGKYLSEYKLNSDETLGLMNPEKNGRKKAIGDWNRRADNIVELPCKVGAKLYDIAEFLENASHPEIYELEAYDITIGYCDNESTIMYTIDGYNYKFDDFGKTVFLTREEAEKALRESGKNDT